MKLREIAELVDARFVTGSDLADREVSRAFAADLLSDVLAMVQDEGVLLITGMITPQVVRVAEVMSMGAVLFVRGKLPAAATIEYAVGTGIPLLATRRIMFDACGILHQAGLQAAQRKQMPLDDAAPDFPRS